MRVILINREIMQVMKISNNLNIEIVFVHLKNKIMKNYLLNTKTLLINILTKHTTTDKGEIMRVV